ncbi:unnamed protein product [Medioppia subpectinata]|uniref:Cysteine protease n=1 Tax=Medioppia subpectinata TaxID=1979941 RepID=A0A7R9LHX4_9ACAR|nr:unnamed protein product [Medioppia subpectinata]CAG2119007.1 unnamed protein product [Medioppia subpectinata]
MLISIAFVTQSDPQTTAHNPNPLSDATIRLVVFVVIVSVVFLWISMDLYSMALPSGSNTFFPVWSYESDPNSDLNDDDFPPTEDPVWLLGIKYSSLHELDDLRSDVKSRIWITYRKNFVGIGGPNGLTSDSGWGCMLRCGQMALAQALSIRHLSRDWRWTKSFTLESDLQYREVLKLFEDKRNSLYSIHQIALMGASEGKPVGNWFGPNTIAQVLKKLAAYDKCNDIVIHVAMDNMVVIDEIS